MEERLLELMESLIEGRNDFFNRAYGQTNHANRPSIMSRFMLNEMCYLEMLNRIYHTYNRAQLTNAVMTFTMPQNFLDPVPIAPTSQQIRNSLTDIGSSTTNCAVCQENVSSDGVRIRQCGHDFHRTCIVSWFSLSPRCPVCRHDIRQEVPATQTPSGAVQTSSQSSSL